MVRVKICGLRDREIIESAVRFGADRIGLVVVPTSPRAVSYADAHSLAQFAHSLGCEPWIVARLEAAAGGGGGSIGGQAVDGLKRLVEETPELAAIQLHGGETPAQVEAFGLWMKQAGATARVVKAHGVSERSDLDVLKDFDVADAFLLDAKPPEGADREGGFGAAFDWSILEGFDPGRPWVLSGGLTPENVGEAIRVSGASEVDVSSGVEAARGVKDPDKVRAFIEAVRGVG